MQNLCLSIIIVNWKSREFLRKCLESIRENIGVISHEILVIDNASDDGCLEMMNADFPYVIFMQSAQNLGFAGANNLAFAKSNGRNILFLNPDTKICPAALPKLLAALEDLPDAGMVGAHILNSDGSLQSTCITATPSIVNQTLNANYLRTLFPRWKIWGMQALFETHDRPVPVQAISGACMLAKRSVMKQVGAFSTDYFMYLEDMDLCVKVRNSGWNIYYVPGAVIVHHGGASSSSRGESNFSNVMLCESLVRFFQIHRGTAYAMTYRFCIALSASCRIMIVGVAGLVHPKRGSSLGLDGTMSKWSSILRWSLGLSHWARRQTLRYVTFAEDRQIVIQQTSQDGHG